MISGGVSTKERTNEQEREKERSKASDCNGKHNGE